MARPKDKRSAIDRSMIDAGAAKTAQLVNDVSVASNILSISAEAITLAGGAAGTTGVVATDKAQIYDSIGAGVGSSSDTSFSWITGTVLTTEVAFSVAMESMSETDILASLSSGEYIINYVNGKIYYSKATTDTSDTCNYKSRQLNVETTGSTSTITPNINLSKVAGNTAVAGAGDVTTGTQRMTLAADDPAVAKLGTIDTDMGVVVGWDNAASDGSSVSGDVAHDTADAGEPVKIGAKATDSLPTAVAADDRVNLIATLYGMLITAGYTFSSESNRGEEIDPLSNQCPSESLVDTTNVTAGTHYYPSSTGASMDGSRNNSVTGKFIDADQTLTLTLEVTNDEDTANADWNAVKFYDDDAAVGALVASLTVTNGTLLITASFPKMNYRYYRWVVFAGGNSNTLILKGRKTAL